MVRFLALAALVSSTTIPTFSAQELVERSDIVARVVVKSHETAWVGRKILTFYDVDIVDPWTVRDPARPRTVTLAMPGGVVGGIGQSVAGTPLLEDGHAYVLCLSKAVGPRGARAVIGLWQGVWSIDDAGAIYAFTHDGPARLPVVDGAGAPLGIDGLRAKLTATPGAAR